MLKCFNPCFNGSDSKREDSRLRSTGARVSILVLMEVTLKGQIGINNNGIPDKFQSLF